jgi:hypothetical protein
MTSPIPDPAYRVELKRGLSVEDATAVMQVLVEFAEAHVEKRAEGISGWLPDGPVKKQKAYEPSLQAVSLVLSS